MKAFVLACIAMIGLSVGAWYALEQVGFSTETQTSSPTVRLD